MNIGSTAQSPLTYSSQRPATSALKIANDLPKTALQLIHPVQQTTGNLGKNINVLV